VPATARFVPWPAYAPVGDGVVSRYRWLAVASGTKPGVASAWARMTGLNFTLALATPTIH